MNNNLFPDIKGAMRGNKVVREEDTVPRTDNSNGNGAGSNTQQNQDPMDALTPQQRQNYLSQFQKLDNEEQQYRTKIDGIKKSKDDLKKKFRLA